eukprot:3533631-Pyramimonas_sp.AAC.1
MPMVVVDDLLLQRVGGRDRVRRELVHTRICRALWLNMICMCTPINHVSCTTMRWRVGRSHVSWLEPRVRLQWGMRGIWELIVLREGAFICHTVRRSKVIQARLKVRNTKKLWA